MCVFVCVHACMCVFYVHDFQRLPGNSVTFVLSLSISTKREFFFTMLLLSRLLESLLSVVEAFDYKAASWWGSTIRLQVWGLVLFWLFSAVVFGSVVFCCPLVTSRSSLQISQVFVVVPTSALVLLFCLLLRSLC